MPNFDLLLESGDELLLESGSILELEESSTSHEYDIETLVIQILGLNATFSGVDIEHHSDDESTVSKGNRITVRCDPKTPFVQARSTARVAPVWQADVTISAQSGGSAEDFESWQKAIDAAMWPASEEYPAAAVTAAGVSFPNGLKVLTMTGGDRFTGSVSRRTLTRVFPVIFRA